MKLDVDEQIFQIVNTLQAAGYETYIAGGAIRDLILRRTPKDYDISTAATPEEICRVFGRRQTIIIGKRFRLVHYRLGKEIVEISTFRRSPDLAAQKLRLANRELPENMITNDNDFGSALEDAFRRDFTVNALFYDPVKEEIIDHTGFGVRDIEEKRVRAIGEPALRFEEDPVRMLRALKLVGQYDFSLDAPTENALFASLKFITHASISRLTLELEKIFQSAYGDKHLQAFHDYGFLKYFLPFLEERWNSPEAALALDLLMERNCRISQGLYRNSVSLAVATLALPFVEAELNKKGDKHLHRIIEHTVAEVVHPQTMIKRVLLSAERILDLQFSMLKKCKNLEDEHGYNHARELLTIQNEVRFQDDTLLADYPKSHSRTRAPQPQRRRRR